MNVLLLCFKSGSSHALAVLLLPAGKVECQTIIHDKLTEELADKVSGASLFL
jgi:hypothetical protein